MMKRKATMLPSTMLRTWQFGFLFLLVVSPFAGSRGTVTCPPSCHCTQESVQCENSKNITEIPEALPANDTLQSLLIAGTDIKRVNVSAFRNMRQLRRLDLNNNKIETLADGAFKGLDALETLILRRNYLRKLSNKTFGSLGKLKVLELSWNLFSDLDKDWFQHLNHLEVLDLARNTIEHIHRDAFIGLSSLKVLNLTRNKLINVSGQYLKLLVSLENFVLDDNGIKVIDSETFSSLKSLKRLSMTGNRNLTILQAQAFASKSGSLPLEELSLKGTRLTEVPVEIFLTLTELKTLDLSQTAISVIKAMSFSRLGHLVNLTIDSVPTLVRIEADAFSGLKSVEYLVITNNKMLTNISWGIFRNLSSLRYLDLHNNQIETFRSGLANWHSIGVVDLSGNPVRCDCHAAWMLTLLSERYNISSPPEKFAFSSTSTGSHHFVCNDIISKEQPSEISTAAFTRQISCHMPPRLHKKCLASLPPDQFRCPSAAEPRKKDNNDRRFKVGIIAASVTCLFLLGCALFLKFRSRICSTYRRQYRYKAHRNRGTNGGSPTAEIVELETTQLEDFESDIDTSVRP